MSDNQTVLKNQKLLYGSILGAALLLTGLFFYTSIDHQPVAIAHESVLQLPGDKINPQDIWMNRMEQDTKLLQNQMNYLSRTLIEIKKEDQQKEKDKEKLNLEVIRLKQELKDSLTAKPQVIEVPQKVELPYKQVADKNTLADKMTPYFPNFPTFNQNQFNPTDDPFLPTQHNKIEQAKPAFKEVLMTKSKRQVFHIDQTIPAGTSVKALLVSSIDAPCNIYNKSDPQPVKLRLLDNAHLPKKVQAQLKDAYIIASAYGDISTERVYMRLERLTKIEANGEFIETAAVGFVSGEDGKFGVRGDVIDKSEKIVANAARSGFLSGISGILQSAVSRHEVNQVSLDVLKQGCASGASSAFDMLSDYYIRRAEQVMPVIQVTAGRLVDITFTHQAALGDLYVKEKIKEVREKYKDRP